MVRHSGAAPSGAGAPPNTPASGGSSTSSSTVARSSTTSQPTAMRPFIVSSTPRASSVLTSTTVLAHDNDSPKVNAAPKPQPHHQAMPTPRRSEEHTSELQSLMRTSYAVSCLTKNIESNESKTKTHTPI